MAIEKKCNNERVKSWYERIERMEIILNCWLRVRESSTKFRVGRQNLMVRKSRGLLDLKFLVSKDLCKDSNGKRM